MMIRLKRKGCETKCSEKIEEKEGFGIKTPKYTGRG
jgi:hypothetical protein